MNSFNKKHVYSDRTKETKSLLIKAMAEKFMKQGHTKARARELAKSRYRSNNW